MIRHGEAPFFECSSKGDRRFSAFYARIRRRGDRTIEEIFQAAKVFEDGSTGLSVKAAKGRQPVNTDEVARLYFDLWVEYIMENNDLLPVICTATGLSDVFGQPGHNCQATSLWDIRNHYLSALTES